MAQFDQSFGAVVVGFHPDFSYRHLCHAAAVLRERNVNAPAIRENSNGTQPQREDVATGAAAPPWTSRPTVQSFARY
jgi:hypothetical protein